MRSRLPLVVSILGVLCLIAAANVAVADDPDLSGIWTMTMKGDSPTSQESVEMTFEVDGESLVAVMKGGDGEVRCEGTVKGNEVTFTYSRETDDGVYEARYSGHFASDVMGGQVDMGEHGKTSWKAVRNK